MDEASNQRRRRNENRFEVWEDLPSGGRRYSFRKVGRSGWSVVYIKEVDAEERTVRFVQEIYDSDGTLVELHEKYPVDRGHIRLKVEK